MALPLSAEAAAAGDAADEGKNGVILYVDDDAPGPSGGDGLSWDSPLRYLQDALAIANAPNSGISEIRIGQGMYKPDQGANQTPGNVNATFSIPSGLAVRGGYAGFGAADPDERDWTKFESILSGDLLGNDGALGSFQNYDDNAYRLILVSDVAETIAVEGITLAAANLDLVQPSVALRVSGSKAQISGCKFIYNKGWTGGLRVSQSDAVISDCTFISNVAVFTGGGGMAASSSSAQVVNCEFRSNATDSIACGGGVLLFNSSATFTDCTFDANYSNTDGGAAELDSNSDATWTNCIFKDNEALCAGGAVARGEGSGPPNVGTFVNCDFVENIAILNHGGAVRGQGIFIKCRFIDNAAGDGGGAAMAIGTMTLANCELRGNTASDGGGGVWVPGVIGTSADFVNCVFNSNAAFGAGGGVRVDPGGSASITNCTFTNNMAAIAPPSNDTGGAVSGQATIRNSILWENSPAQLHGTFDVTYSCIDGGWAGSSNLDLDPMFVDALGPDQIAGTEDDDLRLSGGSPCIDSGDNTALPPDVHDLNGDGNLLELLPIDLADNLRRINDPETPNTGNPGIYHALVDTGAFEFADITPVFADISGDGWVGVDDLLAVISSWGSCPGDGQDCPADLDKSGEVDGSDLNLVLQNWS